MCGVIMLPCMCPLGMYLLSSWSGNVLMRLHQKLHQKLYQESNSTTRQGGGPKWHDCHNTVGCLHTCPRPPDTQICPFLPSLTHTIPLSLPAAPLLGPAVNAGCDACGLVCQLPHCGHGVCGWCGACVGPAHSWLCAAAAWPQGSSAGPGAER
jgi:hypothetical protein